MAKDKGQKAGKEPKGPASGDLKKLRKLIKGARVAMLTTVVPDGTGCRVTYDARILPKGFWRIAEPIFQLIFGKVGARAIIPLSRFLDGTAVG